MVNIIRKTKEMMVPKASMTVASGGSGGVVGTQTQVGIAAGGLHCFCAALEGVCLCLHVLLCT